MAILRPLFILFSCYIFSTWAVDVTSPFPSLLLRTRDGNLGSSPSNVTFQDNLRPLDSSRSSDNQSTILNLTALPPMRYEVKNGDYVVTMFRQPATASSRAAGVIVHNWDEAVWSAGQDLTAQREAAGADIRDPMPSREYQYTAYFERPALKDRYRQRKLIFTVTAKDGVHHLRYIEVDVVLRALLNYGQQWITPPAGRAGDQVRMCHFDLHWGPPEIGPEFWIASGAVVLIIPTANVQ